MTKIKTLTEKTYEGKVTGHSVVLEDGTTGYLNDKGSDTVIVGDEVACTLEVKKNKKGGDYNLLTLKKVASGTAAPQQPKAPSTIPPSQRPYDKAVKSITEMKFEARLDVIELIARLLIAGKIERAESKEYFVEWVGMVDSAIDEIFV